MRNYLKGRDTLGSAGTASALLVRVLNPDEVVTQQGGWAGGVAQMILPKTVENQLYTKMSAKMKDAFAKEGVKAEFSIVDPAGVARKAGFAWGTFAAGVGVTSGIAGLLYLFFGRGK